MEDAEEHASAEGEAKSKRWQSRLLAALLIVAGAVHGFKPQWLTLDWPTIVLLLAGVFLLFVPLDDLGEIFESLEIGKTKLLFRRVKKLDESVTRVELETVIPSLNAAVEHRQESGSVATDSDQEIEQLLSTDKEMALIRVGVEIERVLAELERGLPVSSPVRGIVWSRTMRNLVQAGRITPQVSTALTEFRNIRNQLIHPSGGRVPNGAVLSAVDSGLKLLKLLNNIVDTGH